MATFYSQERNMEPWGQPLFKVFSTLQALLIVGMVRKVTYFGKQIYGGRPTQIIESAINVNKNESLIFFICVL